MKLPRALNKLICRMLVGVFLFGQLAVAGYACPGLGQAPFPVMQAQASAPESMPTGCDQMDPKAANLCAQHCHFGQQSTDTAAVPVVLAPMPALLYVLRTEDDAAGGRGPSLRTRDPLLAAAPPPHALLHCVLRI